MMNVTLSRVLYAHALAARPKLALGRMRAAGRLIDYGVIVPRLQALYGWAAADLGEPRLLGLIRDGLPAYAWTNDERHPWAPVRGHRIMPVLTWLTT